MSPNYIRFEKGELRLLKPGAPLAWPVADQFWFDDPNQFQEGILLDHVIRNSTKARVIASDDPAKEIYEIRQDNLYRIVITPIEEIDTIYAYDS